MTTPPTLWNLPDVVMKNIFNKVGFKSIINLRKVCRDLRNCIDYFKPETHLLSVNIHVDNRKISFQYCWEINMSMEVVEYEKIRKSIVRCKRSIVRYNSSKKKVVNSNFMEQASRDFLLILKFQRKCINISFWNTIEYPICFILFLKNLKNFLSFENQLLKVGKFFIDTKDPKLVIKALSLIDPQSIDSIEIFGWNEEFHPMEFTEIMEMEHWKIATSFKTDYIFTGVTTQNFRHFSSISVTLKSISVEEVLEFKKVFQNSTKAKHYFICYETVVDLKQFLEIMGPAFMFNKGFKWYFRMSTTDDDVLEIFLFDEFGICFFFNRKPVTDVPEDAVIQN